MRLAQPPGRVDRPLCDRFVGSWGQSPPQSPPLGLELVADTARAGWAQAAGAQRRASSGAAARGAPPQELPLASSQRVRGRLLAMGSSFHELDRQVEEDARRRKELEQQGVREVSLALAKLEQTLMAEVGRRDSTERQVEQAVERMLEGMTGRLQAKLEGRFQALRRALAGLAERCALLERGIQQFQGALPTKLTVETEALRQVLHALHAEFVADTKQTIQRDEGYSRSIQETIDAVERGCAQDLVQLERQAETLQGALLDASVAQEPRGVAARREAVLGHLSALKDGLAEERRAREAADDGVVQAIDHYAAQFHRALRLASG